MQHPGQPGRQSIQSVNVHLISLYLVLEKGFSNRQALAVIQQALKQARRFTWLDPPVPNGRITIIDVTRAPDLAAHKTMVDAWARDVWAAWSLHHERVTEFVGEFLA